MSPIPVYLFTTIFSSYTVVLNKNFGSSRKLGFYKRPWPKAEAGRSRAGAVIVGFGLKFPSPGQLEPGQAGPVTSLEASGQHTRSGPITWRCSQSLSASPRGADGVAMKPSFIFSGKELDGQWFTHGEQFGR